MINCSEALRNLTLEQVLVDVIGYLEMTRDEDWCVDIVRTKDGKQNCFMGHLFNFGGNLICDLFENGICNEYMYFSINDGENPNYPEKTPKLRIISYLNNLRNGKEKTILALMEEDGNL